MPLRGFHLDLDGFKIDRLPCGRGTTTAADGPLASRRRVPFTSRRIGGVDVFISKSVGQGAAQPGRLHAGAAVGGGGSPKRQVVRQGLKRRT